MKGPHVARYGATLHFNGLCLRPGQLGCHYSGGHDQESQGGWVGLTGPSERPSVASRREGDTMRRVDLGEGLDDTTNDMAIEVKF